MAIAILQCLEPSETFCTKLLKLEEGIPLVLGGSQEFHSASSTNGCFITNNFEVCHQHAYLLYINKIFYLVDISNEGTYLNGQKLSKNIEQTIISGDVIQLGHDSFSRIADFHPITFSVKLFSSEDADFINTYLHKKINDRPLQFYDEVPNIQCSLSSFHISAANRFEALKVLDAVGNTNNFLNEKLTNSIINEFRHKKLLNITKLVLGTSSSFEEENNLQQMDQISHFALSIACCRNHVMRKWFLEQEKKLLLLRWKFLTRYEKSQVKSESLSLFSVVSENEKEKISKNSNELVDSHLTYYKVFFTDVSELIAKRIVYMKAGSCYVPSDDMIYVITTRFSKKLKLKLEHIKKNLHKVWDDERVTSIISYVEKGIQFERFLFGRSRSSSVVLNEIDILAEESFPLCMRLLHFHLKERNHLRNGGRFQYGLFLKGIGLSLQDSLTFWRHYFTKRMSLNEFMKHYSYHIFHLYGAAGKKADYPPQSCKKILEVVPTYSEYHGCPFKLFDEEHMNILLKKLNVASNERSCIINMTKDGLPQLACSQYFELKHCCSLQETVYHPNIYFEESRNIFKQEMKGKSIISSSIRDSTMDHCSSKCVNLRDSQPCCKTIEW